MCAPDVKALAALNDVLCVHCRLGRTVRYEEQLGPLRSACFAGGLLALGSHAGELRLCDAATGVTVAAADNEHTAAVNILRSWQVMTPRLLSQSMYNMMVDV